MPTRISDGAFVALAVAAASLFGADAYLIRQLRIARQDTAQLGRYVVASVGGLRQHAALVNEAHREGIEALASALADDRRAAGAAAAHARAEAQRYAARLTRKVVRTARNQTAWEESEISGVRATAAEVNASALRLVRQLRDTRSTTRTVRADHGGAATDAALLRKRADTLAADATAQHNALARERAARARDEFEFHITKSSQPYAVQGFSFRLGDTDPAHGRYSLIVFTGDRRIEAANRTLNEPLLLVSARGRVVEVVIREIRRGEIRGSVTVPRARELAPEYYSSDNAETDNLAGR
jgi:hypothetical protein